MTDVIAYVLHGHDNDSYMLQGAENLVRCQVCGELLNRPQLVPGFALRKKRDVSATYDGYTIVSQRFVTEWHHQGGDGLEFSPLPEEPGYFSIDANTMVSFDSERRKTRFEKYRACCGRFHSIAGATPAFLKNDSTAIAQTRAVRTDVMFGSGDEKHPLIILPVAIGKALKAARLSGLDLNDVLA